MELEKIKQKDLSIEILRAFAVILVIIIHIASKFTIMDYNGYKVIYALIDAFANVAVPLFVFISGYVLGKRYLEDIPYLPYLKKRVLRIIPPYIISTIFYIFFYAFLYQDYSKLNITSFYNSLIHADASYHLWFFRLIVVLYIIFPFLNLLFRGSKAVYLLFLSLLIQLIWIIEGAVLTDWQIIFSHLFYFCLGIYLSKYNMFGLFKKASAGIHISMICILTGLLTYLWIKGTFIYGFFYSIPKAFSMWTIIVSFFLYSYLLSVIFLYKEIIFYRLDGYIRKLLINIGRFSFEIYLIHLAFLILIIRVIYHDTNFNNPAFLPVCLLLTLLFSYTSVLLLNRINLLWKNLTFLVNSWLSRRQHQPSKLSQ